VSIAAEQRFSAVTYSNQLKKRIDSNSTHTKVNEHKNEYSGFQHLVDELRSFLAAFGGNSENERMHYSEVLNRAVLGFPEDKEWLLAMINDQLIKKRIQDIPPPNPRYKTLAEAIFAEVIGLSILEVILKNKEGLEEIQVVGKQIFEVRRGESLPSAYQFKSTKEVERIQQNLLLFNNDTMTPRKKWSEAMMSDGSRVTLTGFGFTGEPTLTIRFYTIKNFDLQMLCQPECETMNDPMKELIQALIYSYFNMIVIGSTNTGKTNLIKAFIGEMPEHERIITIEARREMMLKRDFPQKNIIEYEVDEEDAFHSSKQAFKLALRQSPKRIVHAEIRDEDANIYVRACTRGHEGSITSVHATKLEDVPETITDMCMLDQRGMNPDHLTKRITQYVTQIGFEMDMVKGKRKIVRIAEYGYINNEVVLRNIVVYDYNMEKWVFPEKLSEHAASKIARYNRAKYEKLIELEFIDPC
jgi:pilus assembly protein CpaF